MDLKLNCATKLKLSDWKLVEDSLSKRSKTAADTRLPQYIDRSKWSQTDLNISEAMRRLSCYGHANKLAVRCEKTGRARCATLINCRRLKAKEGLCRSLRREYAAAYKVIWRFSRAAGAMGSKALSRDRSGCLKSDWFVRLTHFIESIAKAHQRAMGLSRSQAFYFC